MSLEVNQDNVDEVVEGVKARIIELDKFNWQIPTCCKEGWDDCPHVVNRTKERTKKNVGL